MNLPEKSKDWGVRDYIASTQQVFQETAPASLKFKAEAGFAVQLIDGSKQLKKACYENPESLRRAVINVAAIGLSLNPAEKLAYLIPRNERIGGEFVTKVCLEPSYIGLCRLATNTGSIVWIQARAVYENDEFFLGEIGERPCHKFDPRKERGEFSGAYCVAKTYDGDYLTNWMEAKRIYSIRDRSEGYRAFKAEKIKSTPWVTDFVEMALKSVVRNSFKMWPRSDRNEVEERLAMAVSLSNENEGFEALESAPDLERATAGDKKEFDRLITEGDPFDMYVFMMGLNERVRNDLYHSFPTGKKGEYRKIVDNLLADGFTKFTETFEAMEEAAQKGDDLGFQERLDEISDKAVDLMLERNASSEFVILLRDARQGGKAA